MDRTEQQDAWRLIYTPDVFIGIDPGISGAVAEHYPGDDSYNLWDMPTRIEQLDRKQRKRIDARQLYRHLFKTLKSSRRGVACGVEAVHASPQMGVTSAFNFGRTAGIIEAVVTVLADDFDYFSVIYVTPQMWKGHFGLLNQPKSNSVAKARIVADVRGDDKAGFTRIDRADAYLIARYVEHRINEGTKR